MELYTFGFNGHSQLDPQPRSNSKDNILIPHRALLADAIQILWVSWCDALLAVEDTDLDTDVLLIYTGSGLTKSQFTHITNTIRTTEDLLHNQFFGEPLGSGLQGVLNTSSSRVALFTPNTDICTTFSPSEDFRVKHISVTSGGNVSLFAIKSQGAGEHSRILAFPSITLSSFESWLTNTHSTDSVVHDPVFSETFTQLVSNATTTTALTPTGGVYTWTLDPRYAKCLGRSADSERPATKPHLVEYLSETKIIKIASGGYITAALSEDGECFVWGQACPGAASSLSIFNKKEEEDDDQDEFVKCLDLKIGGREAKVTHVAVGSGHVVVAAETMSGGSIESAVFAAGLGESGQLGIGNVLEFEKEFREVEGLREKKVCQLLAAGWSTWVVVHVHALTEGNQEK